MKIIKQGKNEALEGRSILNTELSDGRNKIIIDTCYLGGIGSTIDIFLEGHDTTGEIETLIKLNNRWVNRTRRKYATEEEAIKDHKEIIQNFLEFGVNHIFIFVEKDFAQETNEELEESIIR